jgi:hypothetical protein
LAFLVWKGKNSKDMRLFFPLPLGGESQVEGEAWNIFSFLKRTKETAEGGGSTPDS